MKTYETKQLILRLSTLDDADFFLELYNSPSFIQHIGDRNLRTIEDAKSYIQNRFLPQIERLGFGNYVILLKESNQKIGAVGIFERDGLDVQDIGFSFLERFQGNGYGFEAASKVMEIGMQDFGLKKLSAITTDENTSSQKLIEKLGLKFKKYVQLPDDVPLRYYETD